jgi:hypothetical protein
MTMKSKPNTAQFQLRKDPTAFIDGGEVDKAEQPLTAPAALAPPLAAIPPVVEEAPRRGRGRIQKIFNFSEQLADRLRDEASSRSRATGTRVTEKDIVVEALEAYFKGL